MPRVILPGISVFIVLAGTAWAGPGGGGEAFDRGNAALARADFDAAVEAFQAAVRAEPENQEFMQTFALVRQIRDLRESIGDEPDPLRWRQSAAALHAFYAEHGLYGESLPVDRKRYDRVPSVESAALLAETLLALDRDDEVIQLAGKIEPKNRTPHLNALLGLARFRSGNKAEAAASLVPPELISADAGPSCFLAVARLAASLGDTKTTLAALQRALELTHPGRIEAERKRVDGTAEFASMAGTPEFRAVLATSSKVHESSCSGGSSCGSCPKRAQCSGGK
ncbi:MAG: hypothetical protein J5J06_08110 [Phycisphaerae bacterium]|nr:hypothetical protein [Phycisphaerae bacterium]